MTRPVYLLAAGLAVVLVVAVAVAVVRSDESAPAAEVVAAPSTAVPTTTRTGTSLVSGAAPTTTRTGTSLESGAAPSSVSTTGGSAPPTATVPPETQAKSPITEDEPGVDFFEDPVSEEPSAGRSAPGGKEISTRGNQKGDPVAQAGVETEATTPAATEEQGVDFGEDPEPPGPKETTASTAAGSGSGSGSRSVRQDRMYTWEDGDNTRQVWLEPGLVVKSDSAVGSLDEVVVEAGGDSVVRSDGGGGGSGWPVFRSPSGALMTLPGGVLVLLDAEWSEAETDAFFSRNGIKQSRVSELGYLPNGFFVETDPGFPSLDLANDLASQEGVELSSPNWWTESSTR